MEKTKKYIGKEKGFTLVEIIVVLVILAILAAFSIPSMLGFVNDAKGKAYIAEAREVYVAAQAVATEYIATTDITDANVLDGTTSAQGNRSWGSGLGVSVSSYEVQFRKNSTNISPQVKASKLMYSYVSQDIPAISNIQPLSSSGFSVPKPVNNQAAWIVTIGEASDTYIGSNTPTRTGKVTKVVYYRNGYQVTIEGNNAIVAKY